MQGNQYKANIDSGDLIVTDINLYIACMNAKDCQSGDISRDSRLVAFYCTWRNCIAVGFGANSEERAYIEEVFGKAPALYS